MKAIMCKKVVISIFTTFILLAFQLFLALPVYAQETPPPPITVTSEYTLPTSQFAPDSVFYGPGGEQMTIANRYFPWYSNLVKTDGWADANFRQPGLGWIDCKSKVSNDKGDDSGWEATHGSMAGTDCGPTPEAKIDPARKPATYTSRTQAFWRWSDGTDGFGEANQSHYES